MNYLTLTHLRTLISDMIANGVDKHKFSFTYAKVQFDVIVAIVNDGYELLVGIRSGNGYAMIIKVNKRFVAEFTNDHYSTLRAALKLTYRGDGFSSAMFLDLLSSKIPERYSGEKCTYKDMIPFAKLRNVEEYEKVYFKGWNDHIKDGRQARNFDKTKFFFGDIVAGYCEKHNISSMWTDKPNEENLYCDPWDICS